MHDIWTPIKTSTARVQYFLSLFFGPAVDNGRLMCDLSVCYLFCYTYNCYVKYVNGTDTAYAQN